MPGAWCLCAYVCAFSGRPFRASLVPFRASLVPFRASLVPFRASLVPFRASLVPFRASLVPFRATVIARRPFSNLGPPTIRVGGRCFSKVRVVYFGACCLMPGAKMVPDTWCQDGA